jgi:hypothetical protein
MKASVRAEGGGHNRDAQSQNRNTGVPPARCHKRSTLARLFKSGALAGLRKNCAQFVITGFIMTSNKEFGHAIQLPTRP